MFATALHEGAAEVFYFLFPHFVEGQTQFGIVRPDLTPRPAYLALAAVGRLLAEARPAGLATGLTGQTHAYAFHARPDGRERDVLVAWSAPSPGTLLLPAVPETVLDHLGRLLPAATRELKLTAAPVFAIFKPGLADQLALTPPPKPAVWLPGKPSPVVLQARVPVERLVQNLSAYRFEPVKPATIPIHVYNFGARAVRGRLKVSAPPAWPVEFPSDLSLPPQGQRELSLVLGIGQPSGTNTLERVLIEGDFGAAGQAVLSFRLQVRAAE